MLPALIIIGIIVGLSINLIRSFNTKPIVSICPNCGSVTSPETKYRGNFAIELILWLCFLIPGLIYTIWRATSKYSACPACGHTGMIPLNTPNGKLLEEKFRTASASASNT